MAGKRPSGHTHRLEWQWTAMQPDAVCIGCYAPEHTFAKFSVKLVRYKNVDSDRTHSQLWARRAVAGELNCKFQRCEGAKSFCCLVHQHRFLELSSHRPSLERV